MVTNILTVDLEEWFVVENLREVIDRGEWEELPARVEQNTREILSLFSDYHVRATFFVLGWVAQKYPQIIKEISIAGHEIGCHSYYHRRVDTLDRDEFRRDTEMAVNAIFKATGITPVGYRAPSWSINSNIRWAFEVLAEMGFEYDSSLFPITHDLYGEPDAPTGTFRMQLDNGLALYEIPASTVKIMGRNFPIGGGGYLRHGPLWFTTWMINRLNAANRPAVLYIHPWEVDRNHPRLDGLNALQKFRQYGSIATLMIKLEKLFRRFDFYSARDYLAAVRRKKIGFER
jgi:polysaccharide deacetylase family protein (PEP-CTERM system associated)